METISAETLEPVTGKADTDKNTVEKQSKIRENRYVILAFAISGLIMLITYIVKGIYPFGDQSVLKVDLFHQYAPFLEELRTRILNGQSILYSWQGGLGKEFLVQCFYYTGSPFSVLMFLFPLKNISEALALLIWLKTALSGATFAYYLKHHFDRNDLTIVMFGTF